MAYQRYGQHDKAYIADTKDDLVEIKDPNCSMGSTCFVIDEACKYMKNSKGEWIKQAASAPSTGSSSASPDLSLYAKISYVDDKISAIEIPSVEGLASEKALNDYKAYVADCYRPIKYEIKNAPEGTVVDYRDKEIRILCPVDAVFTKQNVGANGNPNMYYMSFYAYAPEGAVSFKEGDRGVIVDEMHTFKDSAAGTDKYGRNYSVLWLALANYTESSDSWSYFGKNSNASKYIGWNYIVEWYDADGKIIDCDHIRINLSNEDCHNLLAPYYG